MTVVTERSRSRGRSTHRRLVRRVLHDGWQPHVPRLSRLSLDNWSPTSRTRAIRMATQLLDQIMSSYGRGRVVVMEDVQGQLLRSRDPLHVTELAARCLRAVDAIALNELLGDSELCETFRRIRDAAQTILKDAGPPGNTVYPETLERLDAMVQGHWPSNAPPAFGSLSARALAQALHDVRESHFWSYFADWTEPQKLSPGDPCPVPSSPKLWQIYRSPLRLSPCPDTRDGRHGLCPGGYRGLPSLRLMPPCNDGEVYLDPSFDVCPLYTGARGSGTVAIVIPAEDLAQGYGYDLLTSDDGAPAFGRVRPIGGDRKLIENVLAQLRRAGDYAAMAVLPELTSTPALEDAIWDALQRGQLGSLELVVAGSAWIPVSTAANGLGENRAAILARGSDRCYYHRKFSWFRDKKVGAEHLVHGRKRITILAGQRMTFTTLICKDALETWVPGVLEELRVRLVVVPACNAGVSAFEAFAVGVSDRGWGTVVLANVPPGPGAPREYSLVTRPADRVDNQPGRVARRVGLSYKSLILLDVTSVDSF